MGMKADLGLESHVQTAQHASSRDCPMALTPDFETFFAASLDLLVIRDAEFRIVKVNQAWEKVLGYKAEELEGQLMLSFIHPDDAAASHTQMQQVKTERDVKGFVNRYRCRDGDYRYLEWRARQEGDLVYGIARDVTQRLAIEAEMAEAKAAVEAASKAKSAFLANMSHELRTPLNAILGFSEVIRDQVLGDAPSARAKYREYAGSIYASGTHLLSLISEILDLSKIESGSHRLYIEQFDMQAVIRESLMLVKLQAERAKVSILPVIVGGDVTVDGDKRAIKQVIVNLLANAVKFTPGGGEIEVRCHEEDGAVHVKVRDSGIGIAEELLETVFEAFHRGDAKLARQYDGAGLGLSVCRRLVEMHGGRIHLESAPNSGTSVFFHLPKHGSVTVNAERAA
jgi:PAS domain S-box-containing protein